MAESVEAVRAGLVVSITKEAATEEEGPTVFVATQIPTVNSLPATVEARAAHRKEIDWSFGPVKVVGYVDTTTLEIGVEVDVFGAHIFNLYGSLKKGVVGKINLFLASGEIRFYLRNGKEVWVHLHLKVKFDGTFDKDVKLLTI